MKKIINIVIIAAILILIIMTLLSYFAEKGSFEDLVLSHFEGHHYNAMYISRKKDKDVIEEYRVEDEAIIEEMISYLRPLNLKQTYNPIFAGGTERYEIYLFSRNEKYEKGTITIMIRGSDSMSILFTAPGVDKPVKSYKMTDGVIDFEKLKTILNSMKAE